MTFQEWWDKNYADSRDDSAHYTFGEQVWSAAQEIGQRETVAVSLGMDNLVIIPLAAAVAEWFRLLALRTERALTPAEARVQAALVLTFGSLSAGDEAQKLYEALK